MHNNGGRYDDSVYDEVCSDFVETYDEGSDSDNDLVVSYVSCDASDFAQVIDINKYITQQFKRL